MEKKAARIEAFEADCRYMIEQAVKAPSGHNTQPWLFRIHSRHIEILPDRTKALPVVDKDCRELFISLGCAAENLCLAAGERGYEATLTSTGQEGVTVTLSPRSGIRPDPLAAQISLRQTNRSVYTGRMIPPAVWEACLEGCSDKDQPIYSWEKGTLQFEQIAGYVHDGNTIQLSDPAFKAELKSWMRYNRKHTEQMNDGLTYAVFGAPDLPRFISEPIMAACLTPRLQNKSDAKKLQSSSRLVLFTTCQNGVADWIRLGHCLERFLLKATRAGLAYAFLNQPCECESLARCMAESLYPEKVYPQLLLRVGYAGKSMPYSPRRQAGKMIL